LIDGHHAIKAQNGLQNDLRGRYVRGGEGRRITGDAQPRGYVADAITIIDASGVEVN
jgi:hypothetical protein